MVKFKSLSALLFVIAIFFLSSPVSAQTTVSPNTWRITLGGKVLISQEHPSWSAAILKQEEPVLEYMLPLKRSALKKAYALSASMYFCGHHATGSTCTLIVTNELGTTIAGEENKTSVLEFNASLPVSLILSNAAFKKATMLNIMVDVKNCTSASLNGFYLLGRIQLI